MDIAFTTKLRQSIASFTVLALLSTFVGTAALAESEWPFTDAEPADAEVAAAAMAAYDAGYMTGTGEGEFDAEGTFNRAQAAKVVVLAYLGEDQVMEATEAPFDDVDLGEWYTDYVYTAKDFGLVEGRTETTYEPSRTLNMAETAVLIFRAMGVSADTTGEPSFTDTDSGDWWYEAAATLYNWSVVEMSEFDPSEATERQAVALWVDRSMDPEYRAEEPVEGDDDDEPVSEDGSVLLVELSDNSPEADTIPSQATSVPVATWEFTATGGDVNIERLIVKKGGVSTLSSSALTIWMGDTRVSSESSINSSTDLSTFNNLDVEVEEGESVELTARLNLQDMTASSEASFELESVNAVDAGAAEVQGDFPVSGELFALSTVDVGSAVVTKNGTITNPSVGENGVRLAQFKVATNTNPGIVQQLNVYFDGGSINSDALENLELYVTGESEPIATVDGIDSNGLASFVLDQEFSEDADEERCEGEAGWCIADGSSRIFYVSGDLNTGRSDDTIKAYFDETFDVIVKDARQGFNMAVDIGSSTGTYDGTPCAAASSGECSFSTVQGGDITVSTDTVTDRNVAVDEEDVVVMNFTVTAETESTFKNFIIGLETSDDASATGAGILDSAASSASNFTDIKVRALDGSFTFGPVDASAFSADNAGGTDFDDVDGTVSSLGESFDDAGYVAYYSFTDDLALDAGDSMDFEMTLDIRNNTALANTTFTPYIYIDDANPEIKDSNNNTVSNGTSVAPSSRITGDEFTIKTNSLAIARDASVGTKTVVIGADDVEMVAFSFTAGDAEDLEVTSLTLTGAIDSNNDGTSAAGVESSVNFSEVVYAVNLYEGEVSEENQINSSAKSPTVTTGSVVFDDISWTIPAGETRTLIATGDIDRNSSWGSDRVKLDIVTASSDVEVSDENGDTVTATGDAANGGMTAADTAVDTYAVVALVTGGTLVADVASATPLSEIVVAGSEGNEFAELRLTATYESFTVTDLALRNDFSSTAGDYDDNIAELSIRYYTDEAQTEETTATCSLTSASIYACSIPDEAPIYVPDSQISDVVDYATIFVEADMNDVTSSLADEGDKPAFTISLAGDFEADGFDSGKKVVEAGTNDLTFADITDGDVSLLDTGQFLSTTIDADDTSVVADGTLAAKVAVGDFVCVDTDGSSTCDSDIMYVTAVSTTTLTVVRGVAGTAGTASTAAGSNDYILVYDGDTTTDATDEVLTTNYMQLQATDLGISADATTQTGSADTLEVIMDLTATSASIDKNVQLRTGVQDAMETDATAVGIDAALVSQSATYAMEGTNGVGMIEAVATDTVANDDGFSRAMSGFDGDDYGYVSFFFKWVDASGSASLDPDDVNFVVAENDALSTNPQVVNLEAASGLTAFATGEWYQVTVDLAGSDTDLDAAAASTDDNFGFLVTDATSFTEDGDYIAVDNVVFYNDKFNVDLTLNEAWSATTPTLAKLEVGEQTVDAYAYMRSAGSSSTGQITFVPLTEIIELSGTEDVKVKFDTTSISDDSTATENLTAKVDFGNVSTAGDVFWYDQAAQVTFFGVRSSDRVTVVTRY